MIISKQLRLKILIIATILSHGLLGQDENRFRNFHGLKHPQDNAEFFEAEGYEIFIQSFPNALHEKDILKIKKKYSIKDGQLTTDSVLNIKILARTDQQKGMMAYFRYYLIPETENKSIVIGFVRVKSIDIKLERDFVSSYISNRIPSSVYTKLEIDSIDFVGRSIKLGSICRWMSPHNIQCPNYGQMNWAIFDDLEKAEEYRDTHFEMTKNKRLVSIKEQEWVTLKFEGQETKALRTKTKIQVPKLAMGGSNILIVYYVTGEVRGKYVTCILSQYTDDVNEDNLAPLLSEVLTLQRADGTWDNKDNFKIEKSDTIPDLPKENDEKRNNDRGLFKFEVGAWIPIGNLSSKVGLSPNFGIHFPFINNPNFNFRVDCIMSLFIPQNTMQFKYSSKDTTFMTKLGAPAGVFGLLVTKTKYLRSSSFIDFFDQTYGLGIGIFPTTTDEPKKDPKDKTESYDFDTVHLSYGVVFRKKIFMHQSFGLAIRYNFTPTGWFNSNVGQGFGSSSLTTSLQFKI
jgi:hypothetical protein